MDVKCAILGVDLTVVLISSYKEGDIDHRHAEAMVRKTFDGRTGCLQSDDYC